MALFGKKDEDKAAELVQQQLRLAADRRARFFVAVRTRDGRLHSLPGLIESCDGPTLLIDMSSGVRLSTAWRGQPVECYFRIVTVAPQRVEQHFMFASRILDIRSLSTGLLLELEKPAAIESGQRRRSVRVRPVPELVGLLEVWRNPSDDDGPVQLADLEGWQRIVGVAVQCPLNAGAGQPGEGAAPGDNAGAAPGARTAEAQPTLVDVSAGGMRLGVAARAGEENGGKPLAKGDNLVVRAILHWPGGTQPPLDVLLKVGISTRMPPATGLPGIVDVGVEYRADGKADADGAIMWAPVRDGVYRIAQWVNAVYMEYMRKVRDR